jgi:hypothetical protein
MKEKPRATRFLALWAALALLGLASCRPTAVEELPREELFSLGIGKMDNQVDLFQPRGLGYAQKIGIYMRDGLFYLANSSSSKVMELSSYGDLIFLLYNPQSNPPPVSFSAESSDSLAVTRKAVPANWPVSASCAWITTAVPGGYGGPERQARPHAGGLRRA